MFSTAEAVWYVRLWPAVSDGRTLAETSEIKFYGCEKKQEKLTKIEFGK
jgi:hypothetical protein